MCFLITAVVESLVLAQTWPIDLLGGGLSSKEVKSDD